MRILIISQYFYPENFRINDVVKLLVRNGCKVVVLTGCPNYPDGLSFDGYSCYQVYSELHSDKYLIHRVPIVTRGSASSVRLFLNYLSFILSGIFFGSYLLRKEKYDLIFVYAPSPIFQAVVGIYFKYLKRAPLITWVQDLWPECIELTGHLSDKKILYLVSKAVCWLYRKNDLLLAQSRSFISSIKMRASSVPVQYFPNPGEDNFNLDHSIYTDSAEEIINKSRFNIVFAGNLGTVQSLPMILDAAEILRDCSDIRIILIGSGSLSHWLESQLQSRQLKNVVLAGRYPADAMPAVFERASALLVSLNSDPVLNQTIPAKLQSYLAAGKPIIASLDGEGAQIVVEAKAGLVCPTEDPIALAQAILQLSKMSKNQLESMGVSGRRYFAENFEPNALVEELINIFAATISKVLKKRDHEK